MTSTVLVSQSIERMESVIRESAKNGERLIELKERQMKANAEKSYQFAELKRKK